VNGGALVSWSPRLGPAPPPPLYEVAGSTVVFRLKRPEAREVSVVGDFSDWKPLPMVRNGDFWKLRVPVEPGLHHFAFRVDGAWYVPEDAPGQVDDEFGRRDATLVVPGAGRGR
jgi:1,4-alpha-glucan branching enzyme